MKKSLSIIAFVITEAWACSIPVATSTIYFLPDAKKMCGAYNVKCKKFKDAVNLQGSGKLAPGKIYRYNGKTTDSGSCVTTTGSAGKCLIPYVSVAADKRYHRAGDIISMPGMKNKKVRLQDGTIFTHPGYFIVHDVGGAIDGRGRFDFFTGEMGPDDENNSFGYKGTSDTAMFAKDNCVSRKTFSKITSESTDYSKIKDKLIEASKVIFAHNDFKDHAQKNVSPSSKQKGVIK